MPRRKALLIGINYYGTQNELSGCINDCLNVRDFLVDDCGYSSSSQDMVMLTDSPRNYGTQFWPSRENMLAAFRWLTQYNQPGDLLWLSYSGHGSRVGDGRYTGFTDTICPVDFERAGMISSTELHQSIVSPLPPNTRLTILFDCCHSGSAVELPFVFRPDRAGNVSMMDTAKRGMRLLRDAEGVWREGIGFSSARDAKALLGEGRDFLESIGVLHGRDAAMYGAPDAQGLAQERFADGADWAWEGKDVWMFSGCSDGQTSADTSVNGAATGAMSWAFVRALRRWPGQSYLNVLQNTREELASKYSQIPQLSCGGRYNIDQPLVL